MSRPLLFDTSVWIDFLNKKDTPQARLLEAYIEADDGVLLTPTILQEILQGIRDDKKYFEIKEALSYFTLLDLPPKRAAIGSAELFRFLRKKGVTIRKSNDCLIAYYAVSHAVTIVHTDRDFDKIGQHSDLQVWKQ
ncbi:PIN domain nuclease [Olivibacter ginsenosidimutans]|uniref:Ribonuclease VapC n=1 Tax=Olivibacter ginsenosidimutans TaxID=1176537 RepID=A0ABP9BX80_9SPHI